MTSAESTARAGAVVDAPETVAKPRTWWPQLRRTSYAGGPGRIVGLDAARGLAVIGMILVHVAYVGEFGKEASGYLGIFHGHSAIAFATIAGISLAMITGGATPPTGEALVRARLRVLVRAVGLLIMSGIAVMIPTFVAVILGSYALWFVWMIPFLRTRPRTLLIVGTLHLALGQVVISALHNWLPETVLNINTPEGFVPGMLITSVYPSFVWLGFVFYGMAIGRAGYPDGKVLARMAIGGAVLLVAFAAPFVIQTRSLAPLFGEGPGSAEEPLLYCLNVELETLEECSAEEEEARSASMTETEWKLYEELFEQQVAPGLGVDGTYCLDPDAEELYECTPADQDMMYEELDPPQLDLYLVLLDKKAAGQDLSFDEWWRSLSSLYTMEPHSGSPFEAFSAVGLTMLVVAALTWMCRNRVVAWIVTPLTTVGSMALTAYILHLAAQGIWPPSGAEDNEYAAMLVLGVMAICAWWRVFFATGPLENLISTMSYRATSTKPTPAKPGPAREAASAGTSA